jgi:hypothetical protein
MPLFVSPIQGVHLPFILRTSLSSDKLSRENTVLRANLEPKTAYVIPNAVVPEQFQPAIESVGDSSTSMFHRFIRCFRSCEVQLL